MSSRAMVDLTNVWWRYLIAHQPQGVHSATLCVNPGAGFPAIEVQLVLDSRAATAEALLEWVDRLGGATLAVWRSEEGARVHIAVTGSLRPGKRTRVWGATEYDPERLGGSLEPGHSAPLSLDELRRMAGST